MFRGGRSGPVRILDEIQKILSSPSNDLERLEFEKRGWNPRWDNGRLWFNDFSERKGSFQLSGGARTADDVAEFLQRLSSSIYFSDIRLIRSQETKAVKGKSPHTTFKVKGKVSYSVGLASKGEKG